MKSKGIRFFSLALCLLLVSCAPSAPVFERNENHLPTETASEAQTTGAQSFEGAGGTTSETPAKQDDETTVDPVSTPDGQTTGTVVPATPDPVRAEYHDILGNTTNSVHKLFVSDTEVVVYEGCMYFAERDSTIKKYDLKTGKCMSACADPACTHRDRSCPLYDIGILKIDHIEDGVIYWAERGKLYETNTDYYAYDMKTFKKTVVFSALTVGDAGIFHVDYGDSMYFKAPVLKEGADGTHRDDYDYKIVEVNKKTGEQKTAFALERPGDMPVQMLDDGRIIMHGGGKYYTINRDGSGKHVFSGNVINTTSSYVVGNGVNRIYYSSYAGKEESIYPGGAQPVELTWTDEDGIHTSRTGIPLSDGCKFYNICYVDIDTGEVQTVVEKTGIDFILTDDYLYYRGFDYHMLEGEHACGPEKEWGDLKVPRAIGHNGELWRLDLKTGEKTLVSDNFGFYGYGDGVLIGDYLFQWFDCVYDFKTNSFHYDDHLKWVFYDMVNNTYEVPPELQGRWG